MSSEVVSTAIDCIGELVKMIGPLLLENYLPDLTHSLGILLKGQGKCHIPMEDDEDEIDNETNIKVFEAVTDLLPIISKTMTTSFTESFMDLYPSLVSYLNVKNEIADQM